MAFGGRKGKFYGSESLIEELDDPEYKKETSNDDDEHVIVEILPTVLEYIQRQIEWLDLLLSTGDVSGLCREIEAQLSLCKSSDFSAVGLSEAGFKSIIMTILNQARSLSDKKDLKIHSEFRLVVEGQDESLPSQETRGGFAPRGRGKASGYSKRKTTPKPRYNYVDILLEDNQVCMVIELKYARLCYMKGLASRSWQREDLEINAQYMLNLESPEIMGLSYLDPASEDSQNRSLIDIRTTLRDAMDQALRYYRLVRYLPNAQNKSTDKKLFVAGIVGVGNRVVFKAKKVSNK